jgi:hypothetical protein
MKISIIENNWLAVTLRRREEASMDEFSVVFESRMISMKFICGRTREMMVLVELLFRLTLSELNSALCLASTPTQAAFLFHYALG